MKKEYMKPTTKVVEIKRSTLLTTSALQMHNTDEYIENENDIL